VSAGFTWRETKPEDVPDIHRLMWELAVYEKIEDQFLVTEADLEKALFGERPYGEALLAEVEGKPVGICVWYKVFASFAGKQDIWIEDIYVDPDYRGRGIARAAFSLLARRALEDGCTAMSWSVLDWNALAIKAYRAMGAVGREEWTDQRVSGQALVALAGKG
jgi:GNAT superfamily N-acetyltransferase